MLHAILLPLSDGGDVFNLLRYITFRAGAAMITSLTICLCLGGFAITKLRAFQKDGQPIRSDGPPQHAAKAGTPTMGGVLILGSLVISLVLWARMDNPYVWIVAFATLGFGVIGALDDLAKLRRNQPRGISGRVRVLFGAALALLVGILLYWAAPDDLAGHIAVPFFKDVLFDAIVLYFPFVAFVILGSANATNLADGIDGLATVLVLIAIATFGVIAYLVGHRVFADYLQLHHVTGTGELSVFAGALIGSGLGFLWFNAPPARVFMGDTGSLALGGGLGVVAVATMHEFVLAIVGGIFVLEAASVIIQVASFRLLGRRVFRMAPFHHHLEQGGWSEPTVLIRLGIIAVVLAMLGLATLKLR